MNRTTLVALFVLALLAAGLFFILDQGRDAAPAPTPATDASATPGSTTPADVVNAAPAAAEGANAAKPEASELQRSLVAAGGAAGRDVRQVMLRGRLVDRIGAPRPDVELALHTWQGLEEGMPPIPPEVLAGDEPRDPTRGGKRPTWRTRADGRFEIPLAANRDGRLELATDGLVFAKNEVFVEGKNGDQELGDLRVLQGGSLRGVVQTADGKPAAGVRVGAGDHFLMGEHFSTTGADGAFALSNLRPGKWRLGTASSRFLPTHESIELGEEEQRSGLVLVVTAGKAIAGRVIDDRGVGVAAIKVGSQRREMLGDMNVQRFTPAEATETDAQGYFTLAGLADEPVSVRAWGSGYTTANQAEVEVGTSNVVLRVQRLGAIEGVLTGSDGQPLANSVVRAQVGRALPNEDADGEVVLPDFAGRGSARTAADGSFRLTDVAPGAVTVTATGTHRPARQPGVTVLPGETTKGVRLMAQSGATAVVTVTDEKGKPVADATVVLMRPSEREPQGPGGVRIRRAFVAADDEAGPAMVAGFPGAPLGHAVSDANGIATLRGLPAGDAVLTAEHASFAKSPEVRLTVPPTGSVEGAVALRTPGIASIRVLAVDGTPRAGAEIEVRGGPDEAIHHGRSDKNGMVTLARLVPGEYAATLNRGANVERAGAVMIMAGASSGLPGTEQRFSVAAGETASVTLQTPQLARVHGVVTGADGPLADCQVELRPRSDDVAGLDRMPEFMRRTARSDANGLYAFEEVDAGTYTLHFGREKQIAKAMQPLDVPANVAEVRQDLTLRTGKLRGRVVVAGSGEPVSDAEVEVVAAGAAQQGGAPRMMMVSLSLDSGGESTTMSVGQQTARTKSDGTVEFDDVPVGEWQLRVTHKRFAPVTSKAVAVVERQQTDAGVLELQAAGMVRGKVLEAGGGQAGMALVRHRAVGTEQWSEPEFAMGGAFRVANLPAGEREFRAQDIGGETEVLSDIKRVTVVVGETATLDLQLPPR